MGLLKLFEFYKRKDLSIGIYRKKNNRNYFDFFFRVVD